jgi:hypothetical protein
VGLSSIDSHKYVDPWTKLRCNDTGGKNYPESQLDCQSNDDLARVMPSAGRLTEEKLESTRTGQLSDRENWPGNSQLQSRGFGAGEWRGATHLAACDAVPGVRANKHNGQVGLPPKKVNHRS